MKLCNKTQELISGYIDQELTQQQRQLVRVHLDSCNQCKSLFDDLVAMKSTMGDFNYPECEEVKMDNILNEPVAKKLSISGWLLITVPLTALFIYHLYTIITVGGFTLLSFKTLFLMLEGGFLFLLISVIRQRLIARKTDKYRNVKL